MNEHFTKTSLIVKNQLPRFVRDDEEYKNYVLFLEAYYEWMEQEKNPIFEAKNILNYIDVDRTSDEFVDYFMHTYLPNFPDDVLADKRKLIRFSKELYSNRGIPASFKFMFRVLYGEDIELYNHADLIFKPSSGKWVQTKFININTLNPTWKKAVGLKLYGEISSGIATIESVIINQTYISLNVANIRRNFTAGEKVIVVDDNLAPIEVEGEILSEYIMSNLTGLLLSTTNAGTLYEAGDPIVIVGGLNPDIENARNATAEVSSVAPAQITNIFVSHRGNGFRNDYTEIDILPFTELNITDDTGYGAKAVVEKFDLTDPREIDVLLTETLNQYKDVSLNASDYGFPSYTKANSNTTLIDALKQESVITYGIESIKMENPGQNYSSSVKIDAKSYFFTDEQTKKYISELGILGNIYIEKRGTGYTVDDEVILSGGSGVGAWAKIDSVDSNGGIISISYYDPQDDNEKFNVGGIGYWNSVPTVSINSATGSGFSGYVDGTLGANFSGYPTSTKLGQILTIKITDSGFGYQSIPDVYFDTGDILIVGIEFPDEGTQFYQGDIDELTFSAKIYKSTLYRITSSIETYVYSIRFYDYSGRIDYTLPIYTLDEDNVPTYYNIYNLTEGKYTNGFKIYGSGTAKGTAEFSKGIFDNKGFWVNQDGFLSSSSVLIQGEYINPFTYRIITKQDLSNYKNGVLSLLHPAGAKPFPVKYNVFSMDTSLGYYTDNVSIIDLTNIGGDSFTINDNTIAFNGFDVESNISEGDIIALVKNGHTVAASEVVNISASSVVVNTTSFYILQGALYIDVKSGSNVTNEQYITNFYTISVGESDVKVTDIIEKNDTLVINNSNNSITYVDSVDGYLTLANKLTKDFSGVVDVKMNTENVKLLLVKR